ncbi:DUF445 domain-containing protein [Auritidibacter ignavus]|uniref:DUF445 domain-containing protein n=1 Tax=Auritidibacter ignavus TaxID=678932 RepID=UPI00244B82A2|nr:DUF445 family protein [Auritidibacter ignavus]WGH83055.1 DUF445 family protein [Auritidibacter ignavus]
MAGVTEADRRAGLRRMKLVATSVLVVLAIVFVIAFILQERHPAFSYVRAAAEGGMVGALADWFAVTALFRRPMGLPIPHTAIIPRKKDQLAVSLGTFFQQNFLESEVMTEKLANLRPARKVGAWLAEPDHARDVGTQLAEIAVGTLRATDDTKVRELIADLVRDHMIAPQWSPTLGSVLEEVVSANHHQPAVELVASRAADWVAENPQFFIDAVADRSPGWVPRVVDRLLGERIHRELLGYLRSVVASQNHQLRQQVTGWLEQLAQDMQHDDQVRAKVENLKAGVFADPNVAQLASHTWVTAKQALLDQLADPDSDLHRALVQAVADFGHRMETDEHLATTLDQWAVQAAQTAAERYGPQLVDVIQETIHRWDGRQAADTMELYAGKDLQFIRINGSIIGALAGLVIFTLATALFG